MAWARLSHPAYPMLYLLLSACGGDNGAATVLDPCGGPGHPCTLADVQPAARERTRELEEQLSPRLASADDLPAAAEWLSEQEGVVSVAHGREALRYRVEGGRGHWIFVETAATAMEPAHSAPLHEAGATASAGFPARSGILAPAAGTHSHGAGPGENARRHAQALGNGITRLLGHGIAGLFPAAQAQTTRGQIKRALLLSPFRWQWQLEGLDDGIEDIERALKARDYRDGVDVMVEALDPADPARMAAGPGLPSFTSWGKYDYVHLLTHGGRACNPLGHCMTAVMTPWTRELVSGARAGADAAGDADLKLLLDRVGVETAKIQLHVPRDKVPYLGPGQESREDTVDGEARTLTGPFILLTAQFFRDTYKGGLDDAVVVVSACSSGVDNDLLEALQGDNTAVIGWRGTMSVPAAAAAGTLIAETLVEVDEEVEADSGLTVEQAMQRIRDRLDALAADPPDFRACANPADAETQARCDIASQGQVLSVVNDTPADPVTGASLAVIGTESLRAREIVYFVDDEGKELHEGSTLAVEGSPDDGVNDEVLLTIRTDGLALEEDPEAVELQVIFEGREINVDRQLERQLAEGVWEVDYLLPLGRDHGYRERVAMEVVARLPAGGDSRWRYDDLVLGACRAKMQGDLEATMAGGRAMRFERGHVSNFAKLFIERDRQPRRLQLQTGRRGEFRFGMLLPLDQPLVEGVTYRIEDPGATGNPGTEIGGGFDPRKARHDNWHEGAATVRVEQIEWADVPERTKRKGWVCGTVDAQFLAIGSERKPDGGSAIVRTPYTIQATFSAEITESPQLPVPIPQ